MPHQGTKSLNSAQFCPAAEVYDTKRPVLLSGRACRSLSKRPAIVTGSSEQAARSRRRRSPAWTSYRGHRQHEEHSGCLDLSGWRFWPPSCWIVRCKRYYCCKALRAVLLRQHRLRCSAQLEARLLCPRDCLRPPILHAFPSAQHQKRGEPCAGGGWAWWPGCCGGRLYLGLSMNGCAPEYTGCCTGAPCAGWSLGGIWGWQAWGCMGGPCGG